MPLADASVTEWREADRVGTPGTAKCHSLMLVLLNGGCAVASSASNVCVPLADASVTEWRSSGVHSSLLKCLVPLADASVTEWRCLTAGDMPRQRCATR